MIQHNKKGISSKCRCTYSLLQKIAAIDLAKAVGKKPAAKDLGYHISMVRKWCKAEEAIRLYANSRGVIPTERVCLNGSGRQPLIKNQTEEALLHWFDNQRDKDNTTKDGPLKVNIHHCVIKLCQLDNTLAAISRDNLRRRVWRIFRRRKITERAVTHFAQKCRNSTSMIEGWQSYLREKMLVAGIPLENVANFDQTNVMFSHDSKRTLAHKGSKTVSALKGESTQRCTVMLGATATGKKFPPYIVFKGRDTSSGTINRQLKRLDAVRTASPEMDQVDGFPLSNFYSVQENAWMSSKLVVDWVEKVYRPWALTKTGPTLLIVDEFSGHCTSEVRDAIAQCGAFLEFIPGGYTWCLQVMDVGVNRPFKNGIQKAYDDYCIANNFDTKPKREDVSVWIRDAFSNVKESSIVKTWRKVGLRENDNMTIDNDETTTTTAMGDDEDDDDNDLDPSQDGWDCLGMDLLAEMAMTMEEMEADRLYDDDSLSDLGINEVNDNVTNNNNN
jgi:hypothetical protein